MINSIPEQFKKIFIALGRYLEFSINKNKRMSRGLGKKYVLANPDKKCFYDISKSLVLEKKGTFI